MGVATPGADASDSLMSGKLKMPMLGESKRTA
jgi:hypothetical protein